MKVVFLVNVEGTGQAGEVKEVADGFARNYLLPRRLALPATKEAVQRATAAAQRAEREQARADSEAQSLLERLASAPLTLRARVGEQGRLFGSVTAADIAAAASERAGHEIDRHAIELGEPIKELGEHTVRVRLTRNVAGDIVVLVVSEA